MIDQKRTKIFSGGGFCRNADAYDEQIFRSVPDGGGYSGALLD
jgi:hypothetical protein